MKKITDRDVIAIYESYKKRIPDEIKKGNFEYASSLIEKASKWAVLFNFTYFDNELEDYIRQIANRLLTVQSSEIIPGRLVFVCSQLNDAGELVRHYARAIADNNIPTRMIVINRISYCSNSLKEIQSFKNIDLKIISPKLGYVETAKLVALYVSEFKPEKMLLHLVPNEVKCLIGLSLFPSIPKYNINYTDHTFWLGASFLDINIEFRRAGCHISYNKRNIDFKKLRILPYYPITENPHTFCGFPFDRKGKIVIFSGGMPYKVIGDDDRYFKTLDRILLENKNSLALISINTSVVKDKVRMMKCRDRVYLVPWRNDILELMSKIDIFYGTYPVGGGLTSQIAAIYKKPILSFTRKGWVLSAMDGLFNYSGIDYYDTDSLCDYAHRLCVDETFRINEGLKLHNLLITREKFSIIFRDIISDTSITTIPHFENEDIDYERLKAFYLNYANETKQYLYFLITEDGLSAFIKYPQFSVGFLKLILSRFPLWLKNRFVGLIYRICQKKKN